MSKNHLQYNSSNWKKLYTFFCLSLKIKNLKPWWGYNWTVRSGSMIMSIGAILRTNEG